MTSKTKLEFVFSGLHTKCILRIHFSAISRDNLIKADVRQGPQSSRMRRRLCVITSSSHLTTLSIHDVSINNHRILQSTIRISLKRHNVYNEFYEIKLFEMFVTLLCVHFFIHRAAVARWYRTRRPKHCDHFLIYCALPAWVHHSSFIQRSSLAVTSRHLVAKQGETWREMAVNFADEVSLSYSTGFF
jgi:hypothetical protein